MGCLLCGASGSAFVAPFPFPIGGGGGGGTRLRLESRLSWAPLLAGNEGIVLASPLSPISLNKFSLDLNLGGGGGVFPLFPSLPIPFPFSSPSSDQEEENMEEGMPREEAGDIGGSDVIAEEEAGGGGGGTRLRRRCDPVLGAGGVRVAATPGLLAFDRGGEGFGLELDMRLRLGEGDAEGDAEAESCSKRDRSEETAGTGRVSIPSSSSSPRGIVVGPGSEC